jgi:hypothetical protein
MPLMLLYLSTSVGTANEIKGLAAISLSARGNLAGASLASPPFAFLDASGKQAELLHALQKWIDVESVERLDQFVHQRGFRTYCRPSIA